MAEQTTTPVVETTPEPIDTNADYIQALADMRANSVSREDYQKVKNENKQLLETLISGGQITPQTEPAKVDIDKIRKETLTTDCQLNSLKYWENVLTLRDTSIKETGKDPFVPQGSKILATPEDVEVADRVARVVRECIDYADGDANIFQNELMRRTVDTGMMARRPRR